MSKHTKGVQDPAGTDTTPAAVEAQARGANPVLIIATLCFGGLVASLMQTLVVPLQPELPGLLDTSRTNASWVITATLLAAAVAMPIAGRLADMFGKKRVLLVSAALLVLGSVICAVGSSLVPMVVGRAVQGLAMGFIPVAISLMREVTPPRLTSIAVATMSATMGVGGAIGLPMAAAIYESGNWHVLFWVSAALAAITLVLTFFVVPSVHDAVGGRLDWGGAIGLATGLVLLLTAITKGNDWGWSSVTTLGMLAAGLIVFAAWGRYELGHRDPLIDLRTGARPAVLFCNIAGVAIGFGMMAQSIVVPLLLESPKSTGYGLGQTILQAGLWMAPGGVMMLVFAPVSATLINRIGPKYTLMLGATVLGFGYLFAAFMMGSAWQLMIASMICAAGVGIGYAAMPTLILGNVPMSEAGAAVGFNSLMRSVGTTSASAVMALVLTSSTIDVDGISFPADSTFTWCFLIGAIAAFVGVAIAMLVPGAQPDRLPVDGVPEPGDIQPADTPLTDTQLTDTRPTAAGT
ncbi:MFS transporter [Gordonia pseudamarae]|uniref:MFS transporter n=1 Tax=Gordonia pseudamarae TaxID=2831662 RepID=A0ABX6IND8_9ACTN|nr:MULTISPECIES: MFS transporter [Gordonia]MBD0020754.1 MFS transporter [Gordonia sp. (in: high G+C Gram-positive bacteria)]QHN27789.1 MFS transporter [Gordonia pseudamarae]QHN36670.1 MFS transporter [Gordonia pseudamarae]